MDSDRIYLDNAATSWPKPPEVYQAVQHAMVTLGAPAGRSGYREATEVEKAVADTRRLVAKVLGCQDPRRILFTANGTDSLNLALHGSLRQGDHVITSVAEHNSVLRPLRCLEDSGVIEVTRVGCTPRGTVDPDDVAASIQPHTRLIALVHASNVTGILQPIQAVGEIARQHNLLYLIDAAQTLGSVPLDVQQVPVSMVAAPAHKSLLGPLGVGILYLGPDMERQLQPVRQGGTGTKSEADRQPDSLPDRFESGNHNVPGILGLGAGVRWLLQEGVESVLLRERRLLTRLVDRIQDLPGVTVHVPAEPEQRCGVVSVTVAGYEPQEVAGLLDASYRIQVRSGLHCAPLMHQALATQDSGGTIRFSPGPFTTAEQIETVADAMSELVNS